MTTRVQQSVFVVPAIVSAAASLALFAAERIDVTTKLVSSSTEQLDDLRTGRCTVAITAIDNLFAWNAAGADVVLLAQIETTTQLSLVLRPGLSSTDDVDVIRLAVDAPNNGFAVVLRSFMAYLGANPDRYTLIETGGVRDRFDALASGLCDATLLSPPLDAMATSRGMVIAPAALADVAPGYPGLGIVATRSTLAANREGIRGYLRALDTALEQMKGATDTELAGILVDAGFANTNLSAVRNTLPDSLLPSPEGLQVLADLRASLDMIVEGGPRPEELCETGVLIDAGVVHS